MQHKDGLRLGLDLGMPLQIELQGVEVRLKSKLIGMEPWEYIIIKAPVGYAGIRSKFFAGNKVIVRFASQGTVYGFEGYILAVLDKPTSLLVIDYPQKIEEKSLRKAQRFDCYIPSHLDCNQTQCDGALVDISMGGCRCIAQNIARQGKGGPVVGKTINVTFASPVDGYVLALEGEVVSTSEQHASTQMSIKFSDCIAEEQKHLEKLLASLES